MLDLIRQTAETTTVQSLVEFGTAPPDGRLTGFVGFLLLVVSAALLTKHAVQNRRLGRVSSQRAFWNYLAAAGVAGMVYGVTGVAVATRSVPLLAAFSHGALLLFIAILSFAIRDLYYNSAFAPPSDERVLSLAAIRRVEVGFVLVIAVEWVAIPFADATAAVLVVEGAASVAFAAYGIGFGERMLTQSRARGTPLDTTLRHVIPVLLCGGFLGLGDLAIGLGVDSVLVPSLQNVVVVMTATFLITATVRLKQNVEGL